MTRKDRRDLAVKLLLSALAFGLLGLVIWSNRKPLDQVLHRRIDWGLYALAFAINLAALVLTFARWSLLLRALGVPLGLGEAIRYGFIGNVFNLVIPGAVGGDVIKAGLLYRRVPQHRTAAVASMVLDRLLGLLGLFVLAAVMGLTAWGAAGADVRRLILAAWAATAAGLAGLAVLFTPGLYRPVGRLFAGRGKLEAIFHELIDAASAFRERLGVVAAALGMAAVGHGMYVLAFYTASRALFPSLPTLAQHYAIVPLILFSTAIPLPFGALGLTEEISGQLFKLVDHPSGAVAMMAYRVVLYAGALVSVVVYLANLRQVREVRREIEEAEPAAKS